MEGPKLTLDERVVRAAEDTLREESNVSVVEVFLRIGWLQPSWETEWLRGKVDFLEKTLQTQPKRIRRAMQVLREWAEAKGLVRRETAYVGRSSNHPVLRFTEAGSPDVELAYRTHWVSPELCEKPQERLRESLD